MSIFDFSQRSKRQRMARAAVRHSCLIDGQLLLVDRDTRLDGRITNVSLSGALFRPRLSYLLQRKHVPVLLSVGDKEIAAEILATVPQGYGIAFLEPISAAELEALLQQSQTGARAAA
jgi:hypothetical protein